MGFLKMGFIPKDGLKDKEYYRTTPASEDEARAQIQDVSDQLKNYINNTLLAELEETQIGQSGSEKIGSAAIAYVAGETVHAQIADVKRQIDDISIGSLADGTVKSEKLANGAVSKLKMDRSALSWTLAADSGVLNASGAIEITVQRDKSEMMIQLRNEDGTIVNGYSIVPLDESGLMMPRSVKVLGCDPVDLSVDDRTFTMPIESRLIYGLSNAESINGVTGLKRAFIFVR